MADRPRRAGSQVPGWIEPMLATSDGGRLKEGPEWAYEYKLDGYRCCMQVAPALLLVEAARDLERRRTDRYETQFVTQRIVHVT
ncbi:hypothetical protein AB0E54_41995, partial [Amycolatopsis coloradensis]